MGELLGENKSTGRTRDRNSQDNIKSPYKLITKTVLTRSSHTTGEEMRAHQIW